MATDRILTYREAINEGLRLAMREDPCVILLGEDEAGGAGGGPSQADAWGGAFGVTKGLIQEFGSERVIDTPISEMGFIGAALGAAITGLRPVADLMYVSFLGVCLDQIMNQTAKLRYMSGGNFNVPLTVRTTIGAGMSVAAQHSDSIYSFFVHLPGLKVVAPSTPYDAKGLLIAAIRDEDPVIYIENKMLYNTKGVVPEKIYSLPLGKAEVKREGTDLSIVAISRMVVEALKAARELDNLGCSAEVIDPRSLSPLDVTTIVNSVRKTGRLIVVDEDHPYCGMASEIAALVSAEAFDCLEQPVRRITPPHAPVPFSPVLERAYLPDAEKIIDCAIKMTTGRTVPFSSRHSNKNETVNP
jgi:acetoin:2,6-dichlorophenolindophenol oxidoreductase subunit beta